MHKYLALRSLSFNFKKSMLPSSDPNTNTNKLVYIMNVLYKLLFLGLMFSLICCKSIKNQSVKVFKGKVLIEMNALFYCYRENDYFLTAEQIIQKPKSDNKIIDAYKKGVFVFDDYYEDNLSNIDFKIENKFSKFYNKESIINFQKSIVNELDLFYSTKAIDSSKYYWCKNLAYLEVYTRIYYVEYPQKKGFIPKSIGNNFQGYEEIRIKRYKILKIELYNSSSPKSEL